jgi:hypothetical protein
MTFIAIEHCNIKKEKNEKQNGKTKAWFFSFQFLIEN